MTWLFSMTPHPLLKLPSIFSLIGPDAESRLKWASELVQSFVFCMKCFVSYEKFLQQTSQWLQNVCPLLLESWKPICRLFCKPVSPSLLRIHLPALRTSRHLETATVSVKIVQQCIFSFGQNCAAMYFYFWSTLAADEMELLTAEDGDGGDLQ